MKNFGLNMLYPRLAACLFLNLNLQIQNVKKIVNMVYEGKLPVDYFIQLSKKMIPNILKTRRVLLPRRYKAWIEAFGDLSEHDFQLLEEYYSITKDELQKVELYTFNYKIKPLILPRDVDRFFTEKRIPFFSGNPDFNINNVYLSNVNLDTALFQDYYYKREIKKDENIALHCHVEEIVNKLNNRKLYKVELTITSIFFHDIYPMFSFDITYTALVEQLRDMPKKELLYILYICVPEKFLYDLLIQKYTSVLGSIMREPSEMDDSFFYEYAESIIANKDLEIEESIEVKVLKTKEINDLYLYTNKDLLDFNYSNLVEYLREHPETKEIVNQLEESNPDLSWRQLPQYKYFYYHISHKNIEISRVCDYAFTDIIFNLVCGEADNVELVELENEKKTLAFEWKGKKYNLNEMTGEEIEFVVKELAVKSFAETAPFFMNRKVNECFLNLVGRYLTERDYLIYLDIDSADANSDEVEKARGYFKRIEKYDKWKK